MKNARNKIGTALGIGTLLALGLAECQSSPKKSQAKWTETSPSQDPKAEHFKRKIKTILESIQENDEGPSVNMEPHLNDEGAIKDTFSPSQAVGDCIRENSGNFGGRTGGSLLFFPERIETEPEGAYPIKLIDDGNNRINITTEQTAYMDIVSGSGRRQYIFETQNPEETSKVIRRACEEAIELLAESHDPEDFCNASDYSDARLAMMACEGIKERWSVYAQWGETLREEQNDFAEYSRDLGFDTTLSENGDLVIQDAFDSFVLSRVDYSSPMDPEPWALGYELRHKNEEQTQVIVFPNENRTLEFMVEPIDLQTIRE